MEIGVRYRNLNINNADLDTELMTQSASFLYVGECAAVAEAEYERGKLNKESLIAKLDDEIRTQALRDKRKITEGAITKEIERNPLYHQICSKVIALRMQKTATFALRDAWKSRGDMLLQLCRKSIKEMDVLNSDHLKTVG